VGGWRHRRCAEKARKRQTVFGARRHQLVVRQQVPSDDDPIAVARKRQGKGNLREPELPQVAGTRRNMLLFAPESGNSRRVVGSGCNLVKRLAPQVGLEPTTLRLTEASQKIHRARPMSMKMMTVRELSGIGRTPVDDGRSSWNGVFRRGCVTSRVTTPQPASADWRPQRLRTSSAF
jgi:hypothetical protein